ncbi:hypothetical protein GGR56DRAFT_98494 [Xylariaceae sp. FL0804]|nr:hypothetical protein GGR56DRAFT_98494 [Xylariaceae sp. FL0804]
MLNRRRTRRQTPLPGESRQHHEPARLSGFWSPAGRDLHDEAFPVRLLCLQNRYQLIDCKSTLTVIMVVVLVHISGVSSCDQHKRASLIRVYCDPPSPRKKGSTLVTCLARPSTRLPTYHRAHMLSLGRLPFPFCARSRPWEEGQSDGRHAVGKKTTP